jgi:hypothetical protein
MVRQIDPMAPNTIGDDSADAEIAGEQELLKMYEGGDVPPPGALDTAFPDTSPTEDPRSDPNLFGDPGQVPGSRDPDLPGSAEEDGSPGPKNGSTPYDAEGASGFEGS